MNLFRRFRSLFRRRSVEAEMAEEMRYHLEQRTAEYTADGVAADEARLAAQRRFGNAASIQEQAREAWGWGALERLGKDVVLAVRQLRRSPGFSVLAVVTLAFGIGVNTSMFNVVNGILLKPLPYPARTQLDRIYRATAQDEQGEFSAADYRDLKQVEQDYGAVTAYAVADASLSEPGYPAEMARAVRVTANFFPLLGIPPERGRDFQAGEDAPGHDRVVILSQRTWRNRYGARADAIGRTIRVDGEPHTIIGVLPESFNEWRHFGWVDIFRPLAVTDAQYADRHTTFLRIIGRRSVDRARSESDTFIRELGARVAAAHPEVNASARWRVVDLQTVVVGNSGAESLAMLIGLSGFVMLIACSNLANLLLARTMARAREFAVRAALGASRLQLLRPLIAESLVLSLAGGAGAILVALWTGDWLRTRSTGDNGEQVVFGLDWHVLGWALGASLVTAVVFGVAPALFALRLDLNHTLKSGGRGSAGGRGHHRFRQLLIVGQFALAMVLLAGAGLFIRGLDELNSRRAGWESTHLATGTILLPAAKYADPAKIAAFHRLALERLAAIPGVASASLASFTPLF
jgi:putative ABC transport system permease protein